MARMDWTVALDADEDEAIDPDWIYDRNNSDE